MTSSGLAGPNRCAADAFRLGATATAASDITGAESGIGADVRMLPVSGSITVTLPS